LDPERYEKEECNTDACLKPSMEEPLQCVGAVDVILLLDGSTSIGAAGWEKTKEFANTLASSFESSGGNSRMSIILFSGPKYWSELTTCLLPDVDKDTMETVCRIRKVQDFSSDMAETKSNIAAMEWPDGSTLTSFAFLMAAAELTLSRQSEGVPAVIVTVTDGAPLYRKKTKKAAELLRSKSARMLVVPLSPEVGERGKEFLIEDVASEPKEDNVVDIDMAALGDLSTIDNVVKDLCPVIEGNAVIEGR